MLSSQAQKNSPALYSQTFCQLHRPAQQRYSLRQMLDPGGGTRRWAPPEDTGSRTDFGSLPGAGTAPYPGGADAGGSIALSHSSRDWHGQREQSEITRHFAPADPAVATSRTRAPTACRAARPLLPLAAPRASGAV